MNKLLTWFWMSVAITLFSLTAPTGCRLAPDSPPQDVSVTNSVRRWSAGIQMTFPNPPTEGTAALLKLAKFKERSERVYALDVWDMHDALQNSAIQTSLREGAVLVGPP